MVYVGQTSRLLETRLSEHKAAVKHARTDVSAVAEHVWKLAIKETSRLPQFLTMRATGFEGVPCSLGIYRDIPASTGNHMYINVCIEVFFYPSFHFLHYFFVLFVILSLSLLLFRFVITFWPL